MRINTTRPQNRRSDHGGWEHEYATLDDAAEPRLGIAEIDVFQDEIMRRELFEVTPEGEETFWVQRRIIGEINELLPMWEDLLYEDMPSFSLPEEAKVLFPGEAIATFDPKVGTVELRFWEIVHEISQGSNAAKSKRDSLL